MRSSVSAEYAFRSHCDRLWKCEFGKEDDIYFEEAYIRRLLYTTPGGVGNFVETEDFFRLSTVRLQDDIANSLIQERYRRNTNSIERYRQKHNIVKDEARTWEDIEEEHGG